MEQSEKTNIEKKPKSAEEIKTQIPLSNPVQYFPGNQEGYTQENHYYSIIPTSENTFALNQEITGSYHNDILDTNKNYNVKRMSKSKITQKRKKEIKPTKPPKSKNTTNIIDFSICKKCKNWKKHCNLIQNKHKTCICDLLADTVICCLKGYVNLIKDIPYLVLYSPSPTKFNNTKSDFASADEFIKINKVVHELKSEYFNNHNG
jgi:hypothetical protein